MRGVEVQLPIMIKCGCNQILWSRAHWAGLNKVWRNCPHLDQNSFSYLRMHRLVILLCLEKVSSEIRISSSVLKLDQKTISSLWPRTPNHYFQYSEALSSSSRSSLITASRQCLKTVEASISISCSNVFILQLQQQRAISAAAASFPCRNIPLFWL